MSITEIEVATEELLNSLYTIELHRWVSLQYVQYLSLETLVQTLVWSSHWKFPLEAVERNEQLQAAVHLIRKPKFMSGELSIPLYISSETIKYEWLNCRPGKHLVREITVVLVYCFGPLWDSYKYWHGKIRLHKPRIQPDFPYNFYQLNLLGSLIYIKLGRFWRSF